MASAIAVRLQSPVVNNERSDLHVITTANEVIVDPDIAESQKLSDYLNANKNGGITPNLISNQKPANGGLWLQPFNDGEPFPIGSIAK